jgi:hypothetical protein
MNNFSKNLVTKEHNGMDTDETLISTDSDAKNLRSTNAKFVNLYSHVQNLSNKIYCNNTKRT